MLSTETLKKELNPVVTEKLEFKNRDQSKTIALFGIFET